MRAAYERGETDEFIEPTLVGEEAAIAARRQRDRFNFRPDRMRQIIRALAEPGFGETSGQAAADAADGADDGGAPGLDGRGGAEPVARYATLTEYEEGWPYPVAFAPERPPTTLAAMIARAGAPPAACGRDREVPACDLLLQRRREAPQPGERRELVPSPRDVPTYDHKPRDERRARPPRRSCASLAARTRRVVRFGIINFANADMVGHTGVIAAAVQAVETVDECLGEVVAAVRESGGVCVVTADHGNADHMLEPDGSPNTAHSLNPVPLIVTAAPGACAAPRGASSPTSRRRCSSCSASPSRRQ